MDIKTINTREALIFDFAQQLSKQPWNIRNMPVFSTIIQDYVSKMCKDTKSILSEQSGENDIETLTLMAHNLKITAKNSGYDPKTIWFHNYHGFLLINYSNVTYKIGRNFNQAKENLNNKTILPL